MKIVETGSWLNDMGLEKLKNKCTRSLLQVMFSLLSTYYTLQQGISTNNIYTTTECGMVS